jgi:hypothetical protein
MSESATPEPSPDADPRLRTVRVVAKCLLFVTFALAVWAVVWFVQSVVAVDRKQDQSSCMDHLRLWGGVFLGRARQTGEFPVDDDIRLLFELYRQDYVAPGREWVFKCPGDASVPVPNGAAVNPYALVDLSDRAALEALCSYAIRDFERFPIDPEASSDVLMCDRQGPDGHTPNHADSINVLFSNGSVRVWDRESLGLDPDEPIVVGPDSSHPELRKMIFFKSE